VPHPPEMGVRCSNLFIVPCWVHQHIKVTFVNMSYLSLFSNLKGVVCIHGE